MYEDFFQLRQRPFTAAPDCQRFFAAEAIGHARHTLHRIIERAEGTGLLIGPSGTGKTLLCQALAHDFRERMSVALMSSGRLCTRRALLQAILFELRLPYRGLEEGELRLSLIDHLTPDKSGHPGLLLLVDEAHTLPLRLLEELRMITNVVRDGQPRVRVVLAGGPLLEERFANPKLDSFAQRVAARCYLGALNREETAAYVRYQITSVGGSPDAVFEPAAYASIYRATDGVPRLINQVGDHALILAALGECRPVTAAVIEEAWSDLQQLPTPWQPAPATAASSVIEFAPLDDIREDAPEAIPFRSASVHRAAAPDEQLDQIEQQLSELDDEFRPAGSIGPEMELVFSESNDPFGGAFDDEEVVIDRYASLEANLFSERPLVSSPESRKLSQLLAPWMNKSPEPTLSLQTVPAAAPSTKADATRFNPPASDRVAVDRSALERAAAAAAAAIEAAPAARPMDRSPATAGTMSFEPSDGVLTVSADRSIAAPRFDHASDETNDDADLIVIEEDVIGLPSRPSAAPLVRRQEYRQLFAKLRRG